MVTYGYYRDAYLGTMIEEDAFARILLRAIAYMERLTYGRMDDAWREREVVKMACCAVCEVIHQETDGDGAEAMEIGRERLDQYDVSYRERKPLSLTEKIRRAMEIYLFDTGLMGRAAQRAGRCIFL